MTNTSASVERLSCRERIQVGVLLLLPVLFGILVEYRSAYLSRRMGDLETELIARNTLALVLKSFPARQLLVWAPLIAGYQAWVLAQALRRGSWRAVLRGWSVAARGLPGTLQARAEVRRRTREPRALDGVMTGRIVRR